ncbi:MAG: hypothetical protein AB1673_15600 [Actinomycetota bacterium]|jgi:hypothetical protein
MPKVNPKTGEPMTDDPEEQNSDLRGGRKEGDPSLKGASSTGGGNITEKKI